MPADKDSNKRPAEISDCLKGEAQYSRGTLPTLEKFLEEQIAKDFYDLEANLAILKLYAIYPDTVNYEKMAQVLVKALMNLPSTDFTLCMYQIPTDKVKDDKVKEVTKLATLLETAKFKQFWKDAENVEVYRNVKNWDVRARELIASVVSITYRSVKISTLAELMNLKENSKELETIIKTNEWKKDGAKVLVNPTLRSTSEQQTLDAPTGRNTALSLDEYKRVIAVTSS